MTKLPVQGVKRIIAVAAGKGGVGKSTVAVNIARGLAKFGLKVGIVDADIFGPSIPVMLGVNEKPVAENNMLIPITKDGLEVMSIGFLVDESKAAIWRGPMVSKTLFQLIRGVKWNVDVLVIDMPPGTGDVALTLAESYDITGYVLVATPQKIALKDVQKAIAMLQRMNQKLIGIVENMSHYNNDNIFGNSLIKEFAVDNNTNILAELAIDKNLAITCDEGLDYLEHENSNYDNVLAFKNICERIIAEL